MEQHSIDVVLTDNNMPQSMQSDRVTPSAIVTHCEDAESKERMVIPHQEIYRWLTFALILLVPLNGCDTSRQGSQSLSDNSGLMDLWSTYTHCYGSADIDAIREDAQQLTQAASTFDSAEELSSSEIDKPVPSRPTSRLSVDPAAMAVACTLHAGQAAQAMGRLDIAREMFHMVVIHYPQPRYQFYTDQARQGLEHLDAASRVVFTRPHHVRTYQHCDSLATSLAFRRSLGSTLILTF